VIGLVLLVVGIVLRVVLCVWIGCTGFRYCVLVGFVCVDWLYCGEVLCGV